ncbi:MAG TPA: GH25 family lysozyme [Pseudonocardiaceae bacterium]
MRIPAWLACVTLAGIAVLGLNGVATAAAAPPNTVTGVAVGAADTNLDWAKLKAEGVEFAYVEDTSGTISNNPLFKAQYQGARGVGMLVGAVHFALPDTSSGTVQADYFVANGGAWTANDGILPPVVDLEWNPFGSAACYGLSQAAMVNWISQFVTEVHTRTTRWPVIYTAASWWTECTGNLRGFAANDPLWTTQSSAGSSALPYNWTTLTFLSQPTDALHAYYNGTLAELTKFADN